MKYLIVLALLVLGGCSGSKPPRLEQGEECVLLGFDRYLTVDPRGAYATEGDEIIVLGDDSGGFDTGGVRVRMVTGELAGQNYTVPRQYVHPKPRR